MMRWRWHDDYQHQKIKSPHWRFACPNYTTIWWILTLSGGDNNTKVNQCDCSCGVFGSLEPHFTGTRWITMFGKARKGGLDDVEPHECPIPRKSIRVSCLRVTTLHHRLGCLRLATRQSIIAIAKSHHEQELGCVFACVIWKICCRCWHSKTDL